MNYKELFRHLAELYYTKIDKNPEKLARMKLEKKGVWKEEDVKDDVREKVKKDG